MQARSPKGRGPAVASERTPRVVIIGVVAWFVVWFVLFTVAAKYGLWDEVGAVRYVIIGLVAAIGVLVPSYFSYAVGEDWFSRANGAWVDTTDLTEARVTASKLRLRDSRRAATVPVRVLQTNTPLRAGLARGVQISVDNRTLDLDERSRELLGLRASTDRDPADDARGA